MDWQNRHAELLQKYEELQESSREIEEELENELQHAQEELDTSHATYDKLLSKYEKLQKELTESHQKANQANDRMSRTILNLQSQLAAFETSLSTLQGRTRILEQEKDDLERAHRTLQAELETNAEALEAAVEDQVMLRADVEELETEQEQMDQDLTKVTEEAAVLRQTVAQLSEELEKERKKSAAAVAAATVSAAAAVASSAPQSPLPTAVAGSADGSSEGSGSGIVVASVPTAAKEEDDQQAARASTSKTSVEFGGSPAKPFEGSADPSPRSVVVVSGTQAQQSLQEQLAGALLEIARLKVELENNRSRSRGVSISMELDNSGVAGHHKKSGSLVTGTRADASPRREGHSPRRLPTAPDIMASGSFTLMSPVHQRKPPPLILPGERPSLLAIPNMSPQFAEFASSLANKRNSRMVLKDERSKRRQSSVVHRDSGNTNLPTQDGVKAAKAGLMDKLGKGLVPWKTQYCLINVADPDGAMFETFVPSKPMDGPPQRLGGIPLAGATVDLSPVPEAGREYVINIKPAFSKNIVAFSVASKEECESWMTELKKYVGSTQQISIGSSPDPPKLAKGVVVQEEDDIPELDRSSSHPNLVAAGSQDGLPSGATSPRGVGPLSPMSKGNEKFQFPQLHISSPDSPLAAVAVPAQPPQTAIGAGLEPGMLRKGKLHKKDKTGWTEYDFVLKKEGAIFEYFDGPLSAGMVALIASQSGVTSGAIINSFPDEGTRSHLFGITPPASKHTHLIQATSAQDKAEWMEALVYFVDNHVYRDPYSTKEGHLFVCPKGGEPREKYCMLNGSSFRIFGRGSDQEEASLSVTSDSTMRTDKKDGLVLTLRNDNTPTPTWETYFLSTPNAKDLDEWGEVFAGEIKQTARPGSARITVTSRPSPLATRQSHSQSHSSEHVEHLGAVRKGFLTLRKEGILSNSWKKMYFQVGGASRTLDYYESKDPKGKGKEENSSSSSPNSPTTDSHDSSFWSRRKETVIVGQQFYLIGARLGGIPLGNASFLDLDKKDYEGKENLFGIIPAHSKRIYVLQAENAEEKKEWLNTLRAKSIKSRHLTAILEGYLSKKSSHADQWRERYFVITKDRLLYFRRKTEKKPTYSLSLNTRTEIRTVPSLSTKVLLAFSVKEDGAGGKASVLRAKGTLELETWMNALTKTASANPWKEPELPPARESSSSIGGRKHSTLSTNQPLHARSASRNFLSPSSPHADMIEERDERGSISYNEHSPHSPEMEESQHEHSRSQQSLQRTRSMREMDSHSTLSVDDMDSQSHASLRMSANNKKKSFFTLGGKTRSESPAVKVPAGRTKWFGKA